MQVCQSTHIKDAIQWMGHEQGPHDLGIKPLNGKDQGIIEQGHYPGQHPTIRPTDWLLTDFAGNKIVVPDHQFKGAFTEITPNNPPVYEGLTRVSGERYTLDDLPPEAPV